MSAEAATSFQHSGFWWRVLAALIDSLIFLPIIIFELFFQYSPFYKEVYRDYAVLVFEFALLIEWLYNSLMHSSRYQATVGKIVCGLKVCDTNYQRISWAQATLRYMCSHISTLTLGIGYLIIVFHPKKQALHDILAGTYVIKQPYDS